MPGDLKSKDGNLAASFGQITVPATAIAAGANVTVGCALASVKANSFVGVSPRAAISPNGLVKMAQPARCAADGTVILTFVSDATNAATISGQVMDVFSAQF